MNCKKIFILMFIIFLAICFNQFSFATDEPTIYSESALIIDSNTGTVLYEKNSTQKMYPASTTKIITAIITIENCDLDEVVTVDYESISTIPSGYSIAELVTGEELTVKELLEVLLIHSANDAANVLGTYVGGSIESFVTIMNSKADEIGCTNTNFTNTYGKQDNNHYSTAQDLAKIAQYCMQNETFRSLVSQTSCTIAETNLHEERYYKNTNDLIRESSDYYYEYAIGIKTGYTSEAKNCLISASNKDNFETIAVILGADTTPTGASARYVDSISLFEYVYNNYELQTITSQNDIATNVTVENASSDTKRLDVIVAEDITVLTKIDSTQNLSGEIYLNGNLQAPIESGTVLGTISYTVDGITYTSNLIASHNVEKSNLFYNILLGLLGIIIVIVLIKLLFRKKYSPKHSFRKKRIYKMYDNYYKNPF